MATSEVRPFWGRAVLFYLALLFVGYFSGATVALKVFHRVGYNRLTYGDVVWPGHWSRFAWIQAKYFREEGLRALRTGDFGVALLSLSTARHLAPDDYQTGLLLGQLWSAAGSYGYSDAVFELLQRDFPEKAESTAISFHDQLLVSQRFDRLADLCLQRLVAGSKQTEEWERSLFFAVDHGRLAAKFSAAHAAEVAGLPPRITFLLQTYALWQSGKLDAAIARLTPYKVGTGSTVFMRVQIEALARLGRPDEATTLLNHYAPALGGAFEYSALQYVITVSRGASHLVQSDFLLLLRRPLSLAEFDRICALLVASGDRESLPRLRRHFRNPVLAGSGLAYAEFWMAALVCGDQESVEFAAREVLRVEKHALPAGKKIDFLSEDPTNPVGVRTLLNTVPLMRETIFALVAESAERRWLAKPRHKTG